MIREVVHIRITSYNVCYTKLLRYTTINPAISVYCRYPFEVSDPGVIGQLILEVDFDDGFVAYLNGEEVGRFLMGSPGTIPGWDQPADGLHEAELYQGGSPMRILIDDSKLALLVITSYSIHYTKLYDWAARSRTGARRRWPR